MFPFLGIPEWKAARLLENFVKNIFRETFMFVKTREMYAVKRFLLYRKGIVIPMEARGEHQELGIGHDVLRHALKQLCTKNYLTRLGNWQHLWFFVTKEGAQWLKNEVGLPEEGLKEEQLEIKN